MSSGDSDSFSKKAAKRAGSTDSDDSFMSKKSRSVNVEDAELEPYVRRRRAENDKTKLRMLKLDPDEQDKLRQCINSRERRRMHNLNSALDKLRNTLPQSNAPNSRKLSKINTIVTAAEWIVQLTAENNLLRSKIKDLGGQVPAPIKMTAVHFQASPSPTPVMSRNATPSTPILPRPTGNPHLQIPVPNNPPPSDPSPQLNFNMLPQLFLQQQASLANFAALFPQRFSSPSNHFCLKKFQNGWCHCIPCMLSKNTVA